MTKPLEDKHGFQRKSQGGLCWQAACKCGWRGVWGIDIRRPIIDWYHHKLCYDTEACLEFEELKIAYDKIGGKKNG